MSVIYLVIQWGTCWDSSLPFLLSSRAILQHSGCAFFAFFLIKKKSNSNDKHTVYFKLLFSDS